MTDILPSESPWQQIVEDLRKHPAVLAVILAIAAGVLYLPVAHHGYLDFDDIKYISKNDHVRTGVSLANIVWAFKDVDTFYWHPVTWISHMMDCDIFGVNPGAHHLVNVALHMANALLLLYLLRLATGAVWRSFMLAALFAVHPLNVETVAWLAERKSLLSALFSLLTMIAYVRYAKQPGWAKYMSITVAFALALMSKPMAVTVPLILLLFDVWPLARDKELPFARRWTRLVLEKAPLLLMSAASSAVTVVGHRNAMASLAAVPLASRLQNALLCYAVYVVKIFWPAGLTAFYPLYSPSLAQLLGCAALLLGITGLVVKFRGARYTVVGWSIFLVGVFPVSGLIQVGRVAMADRFTYIPMIGVLILVVWACGDLVERARLPQVIPALLFVVLVMACAGVSRYYLQFWRDGVTLFTRVRQMEPPDPMIEEYLGDALASAGRSDEAFAHYQQSCRLDPKGDLCHYNVAEYLFAHYRLGEAVEQYQIAAELTNSPEVEVASYLNAADALIELGEYTMAGNLLSRVQQLDPGNEKAQELLARLPH